VSLSFCNEHQFAQRNQVGKTLQRFVWPANGFQQKLVFEGNFESLCTTMHELSWEKKLSEIEKFALEFVNVYGQWDFVESLTIIDLPGYSHHDEDRNSVCISFFLRDKLINE
jgi:hypothetical protein